MIFGGPILGDAREGGPKIFRETISRLQLNNFTQKLDFEEEEKRTKFRKKKRKKINKKPHHRQKWVGRDERVF